MMDLLALQNLILAEPFTLTAFLLKTLVTTAIATAAAYGIGQLLKKDPEKDSPDNPYSFRAQTIQRADVDIEIAYGTTPVKGNAFSQYTDFTSGTTSLASPFTLFLDLIGSGAHTAGLTVTWWCTHELNARLAFGEGPEEGTVAGTEYLNNCLLTDLAGLTTVERKGTDIQTASGMGDRLEIPFNLRVEQAASVTVAAVSADYHDIAVILYTPEGLLKIDDSDGNRVMSDFVVTVEIRAVGGAWQTLFFGYLIGLSKDPLYWRFLASGTYDGGAPFAVTLGTRHEFRVTTNFRNTTDPNAYGCPYVFSIQQIYNDGFTFPGVSYKEFQAIATDKINGDLEYRAVRQRKIVESVSSPGTIAWSDECADVLRDLWCRPVIHGDGGATAWSVEYYRGYDPTTDLNTADFAAYAAWCNTLVPDGKGGTEKRYRFCGGFTSAQDRKVQARKVGLMSRATPYFDGKQVRIWIDKTTTPTHVFCDANLLEYEEQSRDTRADPSALEATIFDDTAGCAEVKVRSNDKEATRSLLQPFEEAFGTPSVSQFARHARFRFDKNRYHDLDCQLATDVCGMDVSLGEVAYVQHRKQGRGCTGGSIVSAGTNTVVLDRPVTTIGGTTYYLVVQTVDTGGKHVDKYTVASVAGGTTVTLTTALTYRPRAGDVFIFGASIDTFRVTDLAWTGDFRCAFSCERYTAAYYQHDSDAPPYDATSVLASPYGRVKPWQPISKDDLLARRPHDQAFDRNQADRCTGGCLTFTGDGTDTVTWAGTADQDLGWLRYNGTSWPIQSDAVGTTDCFIYFDPEDADPTTLKSTNHLEDLRGLNRFVGCINVKGVAYPRDWIRIGQDGRLTTADELLIGALYRKEMEETFEDQAGDTWTQRWDLATPAIVNQLSIVAAGEFGGNCLQVGDNSATDAGWFLCARSIPWDPDALYRVSITLQQTAGTPTFYAGLAGRNAADSDWVMSDGTTTPLIAKCCSCVAAAHTPTAAWVTYHGYCRGTAATGSTGEAPNPHAPGTMHTNTRYVRPFFYVNFSGSGTCRIDSVRVEALVNTLGALTPPGAALPTTATVVTAAENGKRYSNADATSENTYYLPAATPGLEYEFSNESGNAISIAPEEAEQHLKGGVGGVMYLHTQGDAVRLGCSKAGTWVIRYSSPSTIPQYTVGLTDEDGVYLTDESDNILTGEWIV